MLYLLVQTLWNVQGVPERLVPITFPSIESLTSHYKFQVLMNQECMVALLMNYNLSVCVIFNTLLKQPVLMGFMF